MCGPGNVSAFCKSLYFRFQRGDEKFKEKRSAPEAGMLIPPALLCLLRGKRRSSHLIRRPSTNWCQHYALLGVSTNWCQHHAVSARIGVSTNWCQHELLSAPLGATAPLARRRCGGWGGRGGRERSASRMRCRSESIEPRLCREATQRGDAKPLEIQRRLAVLRAAVFQISTRRRKIATTTTRALAPRQERLQERPRGGHVNTTGPALFAPR
jgi:hypothetical protein